MNLYRSFGNLMEAWVNEDRTCPKSEWIRSNAEDSLANPRTESVDSGVETASNTPCPATSRSISTEEPNEALTPGSPSQSPFPSFPATSSSSSSSPHLCASGAEEFSEDLNVKLEKALQKANFRHLRRDELDCQPRRASFTSKQHVPKAEGCQRSASLGPRRKVAKQTPETQRCSFSQCYNQRSEDLYMGEKKELSPGLCYLEQICQILEEIARQQLHTQALQMETNVLWEQDTQTPDTCRHNSPAADEEQTTCNNLENAKNAESISIEQQQWKHGHFRQRSISDTRKKNMNCRGQQLSTYDLLETIEEDCKKQDLTKEDLQKTKKSWKLKFGSLRGEGSTMSDTKGQQMHSSERSSVRRRLSQLLRGRRKTQPV